MQSPPQWRKVALPANVGGCFSKKNGLGGRKPTSQAGRGPSQTGPVLTRLNIAAILGAPAIYGILSKARNHFADCGYAEIPRIAKRLGRNSQSGPKRTRAAAFHAKKKTRRRPRRVERGDGESRRHRGRTITSATYASYGDSLSSAYGACACSSSDGVSFSGCPWCLKVGERSPCDAVSGV